MKHRSTADGTGGHSREGQIPPVTTRPGRAPEATSTPAGASPTPVRSSKAAAAQEPSQRRGIHLEVITQDAIPLHGGDSGQLPELLFVHGAWHGAWCWARMQAVCALAGFRSHAVNLRGHGGSSGHEYLARIHLDEYVADVAHVARELTAPFVLLGHSMGGLIAQRYLSLLEQGHDFPRPAGVALLATTLPADMASASRNPTMSKHFGGPLGLMRTMLKMQLTADATALVNSPERVRVMFFTPDTPDQDVIDCFIRLQNESVTVFREVQRLARVWQSPLCSSVPILVLGGAQDACLPPAILRRLATAYGATFHLFAGVGHDLMLDRGWEQVADAITEWTRSLPHDGERSTTRTAPHQGADVIPLWPLVAPHAHPSEARSDGAHDMTIAAHGGAANEQHSSIQVHAG